MTPSVSDPVRFSISLESRESAKEDRGRRPRRGTLLLEPGQGVRGSSRSRFWKPWSSVKPRCGFSGTPRGRGTR